MNNKGQVGIGGALMTVFVAIVVGVALFQSSADNVGTMTNTVTVENDSLGTVTNSSTVYLTSYRSISDVVIYNDTSSVVADTEYSITNNVVYNGALSVLVTVDADDGDEQTGNEWFISGTAQPLTYSDDAGSRSMASLVVIFFALAIGLIALYPVMKERFF